MFYVKQSESTADRRRVPILMVDETDGSTPEVGLTLYGLLSKNGGTFAATAGSFAEAGYGQYYYQFTTGEIDSLGWAGIHITASGARNYDAIIHITAYDAYSGSFIAPTDVWNADISAITSAGTAGSQLNLVASGGAGITAGDVWDYATRTLTAGAGITAGDVWEYDISAITGAGTAGSQVNVAAAGGGVTAYDLWNFDPTAMTSPQAGGVLYESYLKANQAESNTQPTNLRPAVWDFDIESAGFNTSPPYAAGYLIQASAGGGVTAGDVWEYDISGIVTAGTSGSQLNTAASVIGGSLTAADVWDYNGLTTIPSVKETLENINLTVGNLPSATTVRDAVWNAELSDSAGFVTSPPYASGLMYQAGYGITTVSSDVWSYATREITGGTASTVTNAVLVDPVSMSGIANTVWNTDVSAFLTPSAGYDLTQAASAIGITAGDVWDYATRTITGGTIDTNNDKTGYELSGTQAFNLTGNITGDLSGSVGSVTADVNVSTASMSGIANTVWESTTASHTTNGTYGKNVLRADDANDVGNVTLRSAGGINMVDADVHRIANDVDAATFLKDGLTGTGASWTGNVVGNVTGSVGSVTADVNVSTASMSGIANTVWSTDVSIYATAGTAGSQLNLAALPSGAGVTAGDVWSYATREITGGTVDTITNPVDISTQSVTDIWSEDVSAYSTPSAGFDLTQAASGSGLTAGDVWDYATRTITGGAIDTNNDKSGYSLSASQAFDLTGNITGNLSGSVGSVTNAVDITTNSMSGTAGSVWDYATRTLTSGSGLTAGDVWSYATRDITGGTVDNVTNDVNVSTASMSGIANTVWSVDVSGYTSPSAGYDLSNATAGGGITAGDVWNYSGSYSPGTSGDALNTAATDSAIAAAGVTSNAPVEVWSYATRTLTSGSGLTAGDVWDYATRTTTGGVVDTNNDKTGYSLSGTQAFDVTGNITGNVSGSVGSVTNPVDITTNAMSGTAGSVWNYVTRTLTSGSGLTAGDVWTYATREITGGTVTDVINPVAVSTTSMSGIAGTVWSAATRTITGGTITTNSDKTGYSLSGTQSFNLTGNITGSVSGSVGSVTGSVGSVVSPVTVATASMSGIANTVWSYVTRTLTSGGGSGITAGDVWSYVLSNTDTAEVNLVTAAGGAGITAGDVWTYATREITGGVIDTNNDKTDYALSAGGVSAVQSGLSTLTQAQVGTEVDASLLDVGLTSTVTGRIDATVSSRLASSSYTAPPTTAAIATTVWTAATRTLTSGAGATAGDVWSYNISGITGSGLAGAQLNDASVSGSVVTIINGPYKLTSIAEGVDGRIDILADSVQPIQLNCLDGFGSPFNITGYTSVVNVYDVSGALAATYTPTVDFAQNGILSFDIDADITGVTGRYTLVVELTAGAEVIQLGPLEVLVRPL